MEASPLSPEQTKALEDAQARAKSFTGAARVAAFNGWTFAVCAALSILLGLFSLPGLLVGVGLAVVARNELVGRKRVLDFDPGGFELLWKNQIGLMAIIVVYCLWAMRQTRAGPTPMLQELDAALGEGAGELVGTILVAAYAAVILGTVIYQGWNARYYHVRIGRLRAYLSETPDWVVDAQRSSRTG